MSLPDPLQSHIYSFLEVLPEEAILFLLVVSGSANAYLGRFWWANRGKPSYIRLNDVSYDGVLWPVTRESYGRRDVRNSIIIGDPLCKDCKMPLATVSIDWRTNAPTFECLEKSCPAGEVEFERSLDEARERAKKLAIGRDKKAEARSWFSW